MNRPEPVTEAQLRAAFEKLALRLHKPALNFEQSMANDVHRRVITAMATQQAWRDFTRRASPRLGSVRRCQPEPDGNLRWCTQPVQTGWDDTQPPLSTP